MVSKSLVSANQGFLKDLATADLFVGT